MFKKIYKICLKKEWYEAKMNNVFLGSEADKRDGFIHFSTSEQVKETVRLHYAKEKELVLLEVKTKNIKIKWEESRNNHLFPHLYDSLPLNEISKECNLSLDKNGNHVFPSWLDVK